MTKSLAVILVPIHPDIDESTWNTRPELWDLLLVNTNGKYNLPGGELIDGETYLDALKRELKEELTDYFIIDKINPKSIDYKYHVKHGEKTNTYSVKLYKIIGKYHTVDQIEQLNTKIKEIKNDGINGIKLINWAEMIQYAKFLNMPRDIRKLQKLNITSFNYRNIYSRVRIGVDKLINDEEFE
jgi:ADP-ribose pyrophosphatase YjhB (NUDIX family)